jgi:hypothetical protein
MGDFPGKFIKHFVRTSSPAKVKTRSKHDSKWPKDRTMKAENSENLDRKCWSLRDKEPYKTAKEMTLRAHMQKGGVPEETRSITDEGGRESGQDGPRPIGLGGSALAGQPSPKFWAPFVVPFDLNDPRTIYSPRAKIHVSFVIHPQRSREARGTPSQRGGSC